MAKNIKFDISKVDPKALEKLLNRRNYPFAIHTQKALAESWRAAAKREGVSLREWVENALNKAAVKK